MTRLSILLATLLLTSYALAEPSPRVRKTMPAPQDSALSAGGWEVCWDADLMDSTPTVTSSSEASGHEDTYVFDATLCTTYWSSDSEGDVAARDNYPLGTWPYIDVDFGEGGEVFVGAVKFMLYGDRDNFPDWVILYAKEASGDTYEFVGEWAFNVWFTSACDEILLIVPPGQEVYGRYLRFQMVNAGTGSVTELANLRVYEAKAYGTCSE